MLERDGWKLVVTIISSIRWSRAWSQCLIRGGTSRSAPCDPSNGRPISNCA